MPRLALLVLLLFPAAACAQSGDPPGDPTDVAALPADAALLEVEDGEVLHLLPDSAAVRTDGRAEGLRAETTTGVVTVDLAWAGGRLVEAVLRPEATGPLHVRHAVPVRVFRGEQPVLAVRIGERVSLDAEAGVVYTVRPLRGEEAEQDR